jgi:hypothetical protein
MMHVHCLVTNVIYKCDDLLYLSTFDSTARIPWCVVW